MSLQRRKEVLNRFKIRRVSTWAGIVPVLGGVSVLATWESGSKTHWGWETRTLASQCEVLELRVTRKNRTLEKATPLRKSRSKKIQPASEGMRQEACLFLPDIWPGSVPVCLQNRRPLPVPHRRLRSKFILRIFKLRKLNTCHRFFFLAIFTDYRRRGNILHLFYGTKHSKS